MLQEDYRVVTAVISEEDNEQDEYVHVMLVYCSLNLSTMRAVPFSSRSSLNAVVTWVISYNDH